MSELHAGDRPALGCPSTMSPGDHPQRCWRRPCEPRWHSPPSWAWMKQPRSDLGIMVARSGHQRGAARARRPDRLSATGGARSHRASKSYAWTPAPVWRTWRLPPRRLFDGGNDGHRPRRHRTARPRAGYLFVTRQRDRARDQIGCATARQSRHEGMRSASPPYVCRRREKKLVGTVGRRDHRYPHGAAPRATDWVTGSWPPKPPRRRCGCSGPMPRQPPGDILDTLHRALRSTRGAAAAVAAVDLATQTVRFAGIGNIRGRDRLRAAHPQSRLA